MADIDDTQQSEVVRISGSNEDNIATVNDVKELHTNDTPQQGVSAVLNLTTTAQELKVGATALANRKTIEMQALEKNVKWGYICYVEYVDTFTPPISLSKIRKVITREEWAPPYLNFRGYKSIRIPDQIVSQIISLRPNR